MKPSLAAWTPLLALALAGAARAQPSEADLRRLLQGVESELALSVRYERAVDAKLGDLQLRIPAGTDLRMRVGFAPRGEASQLSTLVLAPSQPVRLGPLSMEGLRLDGDALKVSGGLTLLRRLGLGGGVVIERISSGPEGLTLKLRSEGAARAAPGIRIRPDGVLQLHKPGAFSGGGEAWWTPRGVLGRPVRVQAKLPSLPHWPPHATDLLALASRPVGGSAPRASPASVSLSGLGPLRPDAVDLRLGLRRAPGAAAPAPPRRGARLSALSSPGQLVLALFLRELPGAVLSRDPGHVRALFHTFRSLDLWRHYGEFALGSALAEAALARFRHGLLKTSVVLAAGMALPSLLRGTFSPRTLAIDFGALTLSTSAVDVALRGLPWVGRLAGAAKVGSLGGFLYGAGKLAVVLYLSEQLSQAAERHFGGLRRARARVGARARDWVRALEADDATPASVEAATQRLLAAIAQHHEAQLAPLRREQARLQARWAALTRRDRALSAARALPGVAEQPHLSAHLRGRDGSLAAAGERLTAGDEARLARDLDAALSEHSLRADALLAQLYQAPRDQQLLEGVSLAATGRWERARRDRRLRAAIEARLADDRPTSQVQSRELLAEGLRLLERRRAPAALRTPVERGLSALRELELLERGLRRGLEPERVEGAVGRVRGR